MFKDKTGRKLEGKEASTKIKNRMYHYWLDFKLMLLRWIGHIPSRRVRKWIYKLSGVTMGEGSVFHMWANFYQPNGIVIGEDTIIGDHAFLDGYDRR